TSVPVRSHRWIFLLVQSRRVDQKLPAGRRGTVIKLAIHTLHRSILTQARPDDQIIRTGNRNPRNILLSVLLGVDPLHRTTHAGPAEGTHVYIPAVVH